MGVELLTERHASQIAQNGKTYLVPNDGKCLHYYFYFVDEELGFCHVRVPTWLPCRLQICLNGHNWLAGRLRQAGIEYRMADNAFTHIGEWQKAQTISDGWEAKRIHQRLNGLALQCCSIYRDFATGYHWSVNQCAIEDPRAGRDRLDKLSQPVELEGRWRLNRVRALEDGMSALGHYGPEGQIDFGHPEIHAAHERRRKIP